jgi:transcriptional regulator with XRE-family HTH domain
MHNRLKQFLAAENISQAQFADRIKIGKANVSHVLAGRNKPGYDFISAMMAGFPQLNINWLFFGTGKMYSSTPSVSNSVDHDSQDSIFPDYQPDLLFANYDEMPAESANIQTTIASERLDDAIKTPVKQRSVAKIILMYDDGTFQEL